MDNRVGQQLGNYTLARLLGQGGFAEVYLGIHLYLNTMAAIKVLQIRMTNEDSTGFLREARTIAGLVHPNIIRVLDFGLDNGTPFLVMEYAPNGTLRQIFPKGTAVSPDRVLPYIKQVASALMYAHNQKLIHRDVKPENILLSANFEALLSDFGIATIEQSSRQSSIAETMATVGTVSYMAPEQIQGKSQPASDQYALGVILYECLTGERPFKGTFTELANQHMYAPPQPLREKMLSISPDIENVVMTALAKNPQQRFQTVQAFANAFEQACRSREAPTIVPSQPDPSDAPTFVSHSPNSPDAPTFVSRSSNPTEGETLIARPQFTPPPPPMQPNYIAQQAPQGPVLLPVDRNVSYSPPQAQDQLSQRGTSRRVVVLGLVGLVGLGAIGGAIAWWKLQPSPTGNLYMTPTVPPTVQHSPTTTVSPTTSPTQRSSTLGKAIFTYRGQTGIIYADIWSPDGARIASGGQDTTVNAWDASTGLNALGYSGHTKAVYALSWASNSRYIASGGEDTVVQVWDVQANATAFSYMGHSLPVYAVAFSPDGTRIASGGRDKTVQVWDATTGTNVMTYSKHTGFVRGIVWSPDGSRIASASDDKTVQIWDASSGTLYVTCQGHTNIVTIVDWSHHANQIVSGSQDTTVRIWDASSGTLLRIYHGHTDHVWTVAWSPNGQTIASAGRDSTVQLWNAVTANTIYTYRGHKGNVWDALWSPDGLEIASSSADGSVQVWHTL